MGDVPRRLEPTDGERLAVLASRMAPGSDSGQTRFGHDVPEPPKAMSVPAIVIVEHGDDGTAARPLADHVRWVGAATPVNAADYDDWYPANI